ncbi:homoserine dehydrogenase [Tepidibacillus decaturensis]|uniref:homoserine dehydrogenase n=1 Tax=Tepidibacillus decaturensis TaxID=1413211 RepID=UPI0008386AB7|nr:homoserine dehydrogenase [Tepidibacillus decaturensis]
MESIKVALLGLGTVGTGVYQTIISHQKQLQHILGKSVEVVAILIQDIEKKRVLEMRDSILVTTNYQDILQLPKLDVVIEMIGGRDPAYQYIIQALSKGCHVITANKELMAFNGAELKEIAKQYGVMLAFEASVAGGIPIIRTIKQLLQVNQITKIQGIINGTSNYILSQMRKKRISFKQALKEAQAAGFAEADPTNDIEGWDAFYKLMVLSDIIFPERPNWASVKKIGVSEVTLEQLALVEELGLRMKLVASLYKSDTGWNVRVEPTCLAESNPLYSVEGVDNAIIIETDVVGRLFLQGPGAGSLPTASAIVEDLVDVLQHPTYSYHHKKEIETTATVTESIENPFWLIIHEQHHPMTSADQMFWQVKLHQFELEMIKRETISVQKGFLVGHLVKGNEEQILALKQNVNHRTKMIYYPALSCHHEERVEEEGIKLGGRS